MAITLLANQCPAIQMVTSMTSILGAASSSMTGGLQAKRLRTGSAGAPYMSTDWNENAMRNDIAGTGGGVWAYGILWGLTLSVPVSGLAVPVTKGQAAAEGLLEIQNDTTVTVTDPSDGHWCWIWLTKSNTLVSQPGLTVLTPPTNGRVLLGAALVSGGNVVAVDTSGVCYLRAGERVLERTTADIGPPTDTPSASLRFRNRSLDGDYYWNGTEYVGRSTFFLQNKNTLASGKYAYVPAGVTEIVADPFVNNGTLIVDGALVVTRY